ncbi:MAG: SufD family Fe-S cluster assembly protein [Chlamydiota bacterium]
MNAFLEHVKPLYNSEDPFRLKAWNRFQEMGIPSYPYLPLGQLRSFKIAAPKKEILLQKNADFPYDLVFVNGKFRPDLSDPLQDDIVLMPLSEALIDYAAFLKTHLEKQSTEEKDAFALLTTALTKEAIFLYVPPGALLKTRIIHIQTAKSSFGRLDIFLGPGAEAEITLKNYTQITDPSFSSELIHLHLEKDSICRLQKIDQHHNKQWAFSFVRAFQKTGSTLHTVLASSGALSARSDFITTLAEEGAKAYIGGASRLKAFNQGHTQVLVRHLAPNTESQQLFKTILEDVSRSSFLGEIYVAKEALKTNAFQLSRSLLLSEKAISYSRPQLQIFADDVKASHGSTVGQLDEEMLFYIQSRGISKADATAMLLSSFVDDLLTWFKTPLSQTEALKILA